MDKPTIADSTEVTYTSLNHAYGFFNDRLFEGRLHDCLITYQRKAKTRGYFRASGSRHASRIIRWMRSR